MYLKQFFFFCALIFSTTKFSFAEDGGDGWETVSKVAVDYGSEKSRREHYEKEPTSKCEDCTEEESHEPEQSEEPMQVFTKEGGTWTISLKTGTVLVEPSEEENMKGSVTGTVNGSIFDGKNFRFHHFELEWEIDEHDYVWFKARNCFYNDDYDSFGDALDHKDGVLQLVVLIEANGDKDNEKFVPVIQSMKGIKRDGDSAIIKSQDSYNFFKTFPEDTTFKIYESTFYNKISGQNYPFAITAELPPNKKSNYASRKQFDEAFKHLLDINNKPLRNTIPPKDPPTSPPKEVTGLEVTPAQDKE